MKWEVQTVTLKRLSAVCLWELCFGLSLRKVPVGTRRAFSLSSPILTYIFKDDLTSQNIRSAECKGFLDFPWYFLDTINYLINCEYLGTLQDPQIISLCNMHPDWTFGRTPLSCLLILARRCDFPTKAEELRNSRTLPQLVINEVLKVPEQRFPDAACDSKG